MSDFAYRPAGELSHIINIITAVIALAKNTNEEAAVYPLQYYPAVLTANLFKVCIGMKIMSANLLINLPISSNYVVFSTSYLEIAYLRQKKSLRCLDLRFL